MVAAIVVKDKYISPRDLAVFKYGEGDFEKFYQDALSGLGIMVATRYECRPQSSLAHRFSRHATVFKDVVTLGGCLHGRKLLIVFDGGRRDCALLSALKPASCQVAIWYWNTFGTNEPSINIRKLGERFHFYTFDSGEAVAYGMGVLDQFFPFDTNCPAPNFEVGERTAFFVGWEKGRWTELCRLGAALEGCGFSCNFNVIPQGDLDFGERADWVMREVMPYSKVLATIGSSEVVVDYAKPGQVGMTTRCLEALQYGKKIITNNRLLVDDAAWNSNNVFLVEGGTIERESLSRFLVKPYDSSRDDELKSRYSLKHWVEQVAIQSLGVDGIAWD